MALWGNKDQSNNSPLFGPALVNKTSNTANRDALYQNTTPDAFVTGQTVGVYGNQVTETGPAGWVLKRVGSGGRAGRTLTEILVAMGSIGPGDAAPAGDSYWIVTLESIGQGSWGTSVTTDSQNNIYILAPTNTATENIDFLIAKYNSSGVLQWQRSLGAWNQELGNSIAIDSQNNVYITGTTSSQGEGALDIVVAKYNSSGVLQWQKLLGGLYDEKSYGIAIDNLDNVYIAGSTQSVGEVQGDFLIAKYNSSGVLQWQKVLGGVSTETSYGIATDSQNNVYITGITASQGEGSNDLVTVKYDSSGVLQWQKLLGGWAVEYSYGIAIDNLDNVYITGVTQTEGQGGNDLITAKYNSSGVLQWQKILGGIANDNSYSIAIDSQNNVYIAGESSNINPNWNCLIVKYDSNGVLQFVRGLGRTSTVYNGAYSLTIDSNDNIIITGENDVDSPEYNYMILISKLPGDGSLTGTYGDFSYYEVTDLVSNTATLVSNTATLTSNTGTLVSNTATLTEKTVNLVSTLTTVS